MGRSFLAQGGAGLAIFVLYTPTSRFDIHTQNSPQPTLFANPTQTQRTPCSLNTYSVSQNVNKDENHQSPTRE